MRGRSGRLPACSSGETPERERVVPHRARVVIVAAVERDVSLVLEAAAQWVARAAQRRQRTDEFAMLRLVEDAADVDLSEASVSEDDAPHSDSARS